MLSAVWGFQRGGLGQVPELLGCGSELKLFGVPSENLPVFGCWRRSKAMTEKGFRIASQATWFVQEWRRGFLREFLLF